MTSELGQDRLIQDHPGGDGLVVRRLGEAHYDGAVSLMSGSVAATVEHWETEQLFHGLKLIIVEAGELVCKIQGNARRTISGPCICAVWNLDTAESMQAFTPGCAIPFTTITLSASTTDQLMSPAYDAVRRAIGMDAGGGPRLAVTATPRAVRSLCREVARPSFSGGARSLYLSGKALEIAAYALDAFAAPDARDIRLSQGDLGKVREARQILLDRLSTPPQIGALARMVGLNERKLKIGFKELFGDSIYGFVQARRMEAAHALLADGQMSVSSVAYALGYTPAHFSVAFRKAYGCSPRDLKA